ncbi:MAG: DEAD/DEAH box helicase [Candidatus Neomarinimicrobiota bacterium]|nr:DEAD/DEAH box helicase [Candidatus Neomarinimicrobiota bacterium]
MQNFLEIKLKKDITKALNELGFITPTPIQSKTIPLLMDSDQDLIGAAQTGTGKTAAFGIPSIHLADVSNKIPQTLILCPTRELCIQITNDLKKYAKYLNKIQIVPVYGGASMETQIRALKKGTQIVIGTPGRTKDMIKRKKLLLASLDRIVLDEADEMLSMGFKEDLDFILSKAPGQVQKLLFSATMPKKVTTIIKEYMNNPVTIAVDPINTAAINVVHRYHMVQAKDRYEVVKRIADINPNIYGIVFCRTRRETKDVSNRLMVDGYNADALHGELSQSQRDEVMNRFRKARLQLLVATDVAARGLDVNNLSHIINYNLPDDPEIYTHRSGRTGRAGKKGISIAIIHSREVRRLKDIEKISGIKFSKELVPTGDDICKKQLYALVDKIKNIEVDNEKIEPFLSSINEKLEGLDRDQLIKHFVSAEFNRFISYYKNARDINILSGNKSSSSKRDRKTGGRRGGVRYNFTRFYINIGTKQRLNPLKLISLINESLNSSDHEIGKIEVLKTFSFFEIDSSVSLKLVETLNGTKFNRVNVKAEISREKSAPSNSKMKKDNQRKGRSKKNRWRGPAGSRRKSRRKNNGRN